MNEIKSNGGKVIGYLKETSTGKTLLAPGGRVLGYYNENSNTTMDAGGRVIGYGDQLLMLLQD